MPCYKTPCILISIATIRNFIALKCKWLMCTYTHSYICIHTYVYVLKNALARHTNIIHLQYICIDLFNLYTWRIRGSLALPLNWLEILLAWLSPSPRLHLKSTSTPSKHIDRYHLVIQIRNSKNSLPSQTQYTPPPQTSRPTQNK